MKESRVGGTAVSWRLVHLQAGSECGDMVPRRSAFGRLLRSRSHRDRATSRSGNAVSPASMQAGSECGDMVPSRSAFGHLLRSRSHRDRATSRSGKAGSPASMQVGSECGDMVSGRIAFGQLLGKRGVSSLGSNQGDVLGFFEEGARVICGAKAYGLVGLVGFAGHWRPFAALRFPSSAPHWPHAARAR